MACSTEGPGRKRVMPPTYFLIALLIVIASRFLLQGWLYWTWVTLVMGAILTTIGIALNLAPDSAFKKESTPVSPDAMPSALVTSGVFRFTRNPMYLGMTLILAGVALLVGQPAAVLVAPAFALLLDRRFIPGEERNLENAFGRAYDRYNADVRRWV